MTQTTLATELDHPALGVLPEFPTDEDLTRFGQLVLSLEPEHGVVDIGTMHHHAEGLYGRSVAIKKETFLVGLPHKAGHLNVCIGDITVWTKTGRQRLTGAHILPADAGVSRVGFAHEDTTWLSVHRNDTGGLDLGAIEDALVHNADQLMTRRSQTLPPSSGQPVLQSNDESPTKNAPAAPAPAVVNGDQEEDETPTAKESQ